MHEASLYPVNTFITLTYDDNNIPDGDSLDYRDVQLFLKKLRLWRSVYDYRRTPTTVTKGKKQFTIWKSTQLEWSKIRFFCAGEYGGETKRPHYHLIIFNFDFIDKELWKKSKRGFPQWRSALLEQLWTKGNSSISECTFETASYAAQYCTNKLGLKKDSWDYDVLDIETGTTYKREAEFVHMSTKPGIGFRWFQKFKSDVFPHDICVMNGVPQKPPSYYTRKLKESDPESYEALQYQRYIQSRPQIHDQTDERLLVKERVLKAQKAFYSGKRGL